MSTTKATPTPGPWIAKRDSLYSPADVNILANGERIATAWRGFDSDLPAPANARLMSAAPDMLEALENIVALASLEEWYTATTGRQILFQAAEAAIQKARGGQ